MTRTATTLAWLVLLAPVAAAGQDAETVRGVDAERILFGQSAALSGPASALGQGMRLGIRAAFEEANRNGGVRGRRLELVSLDDGYQPERALENTRQLIQEEGVFGLIGPVGTPTSLAAEPAASQAGVPYIAPFTGAEFLRDPGLARTTVNVRASYYQETAEAVDRLVGDLGHSRFAVLYQDDSFGRAGLTGVERALVRNRLDLVAKAPFPRNSTAVKTAVVTLRRARPEAVIMVGAYDPVGAFVQWSRRIGFDPTFLTISFVGSAALADRLGPEGRGILITQVVPFPSDPEFPVTQQYQAALRRVDPNAVADLVSLEGYIAGRLTVQVLEECGANPTPAHFLAQVAEVGRFSIGGFSLQYGPEDNQGSNRVFLTRIEANGELAALSRLR